MTIRYALAILLAAIYAFPTHPAEAASPKRGWGGAGADWINATNSSWYYHWWHTRPGDDASANGDWIPLIKFYNGSDPQSKAQNLQNKLNLIQTYDEVDSLFVLNEPERSDQSNVSVADAITMWEQVQANLPGHRLISPGVSDDGNGQAWLSSFMSQVNARNNNTNPNDDLRVDAVAFHWYGASSPDNPVGAANNFLNRVASYHQAYNRPVWITEFAMHDWGGNHSVEAMRAANATFLDIVIPALENRSYVEGYSFYNWFGDSRIVEGNPLLPTNIGDEYVGTVLPGQTMDLGGQSLGTDVTYLRGGVLTNTGPAQPSAMRSLDALGGLSTITGDSDWAISALPGSAVNVRSGATLRKTGASTIDFTGSPTVNVSGELQIKEGGIRIGGGRLTGGGVTKIDSGAVLDVTSGRGRSAVSNQTLELSGELIGSVSLSTGATLRVTSSQAVVRSSLSATAGSVIDVGGPGFLPSESGPTPVATGLRLDYDAAADPAGDAVWSEASGLGPALTFAQNASPIPVADGAFPGLSAAYSIPAVGGASGLNTYFELGRPLSKENATFEVVFNIADLGAGSDQVLLEVGGAPTGVSFVVSNDTLSFNVDGDGGDSSLTHGLSLGWNQAIGVIEPLGATDRLTLYVNGVQVGVLDNLDINDWSGGNPTGLGAGSGSVNGVVTEPGNPFHGDIASARYYSVPFTAADVQQNYDALTTVATPEPTTMHVEGDLSILSGGELRLDLGDNGASDRVEVGGLLALAGAELVLGWAGEGAPNAGDVFDLLDFETLSGEFATLDLPTLASGLMWDVASLGVDGSIAVTLAGDYNGDGLVDAADYTVWRDAEGDSVTPSTGADGNGDGFIDGADRTVWAAAFGGSVASAATQSVPEPAGVVLLGIVATAVATRSRRFAG